MASKKSEPKKLEYIKTNDLIPYVNNSRTHSDAQVAQIASSIKEFGFTNPVLIDKDNGIIAGHGRLMAANKLGLETVPCLRLSDLTPAQLKAYIIADNKLALNAGWNDELLRIELDALKEMDFDFGLTGFNQDELDALFLEPNFDAGTLDDQGKLDELAPKMVNCPHCSKDFDSRGREIA